MGEQRRSGGKRRIIVFLTVSLACIALLALLGSQLLVPAQSQTNSGISPLLGQSGTPSTTTATGTFREYPLPQPNDGLMRLAIDHQGRVWFGEMGRNFLAVFDPRTQTFQQWTPPGGKYGMMGIQVAADDTIWFAEEYANYIGHYFPTTGRYQLYRLPWFTVPDPSNPGKTLLLPLAPNDLVLDGRGNAWFTELNAGALGRLDTHTGFVQQYPLAGNKSVQAVDPYGVTVDRQGMVWFTEIGGKRIGRLDPATGGIRLYTPAGPNVAPMEIASDARGIIWATTFNANLLLSLDPRTGAFTAYNVSSAGGNAGAALYGLVVTPDNDVWVTVSAENAIARLDVAAHRFVSYHIPTDSSLPISIVEGANHTLWFTEGGSDKIGMVQS